MGEIVQGIPVSPGIVFGPACVMRGTALNVPHATVPAAQVEEEVERFRAARAVAVQTTRDLRDRVESRLGKVQAKIFDPQLLMLEDPELIDETITYIRDSYLTAERAFSVRVLEFRSAWLDATHARVLDRVADLSDVQARVLSSLMDLPQNGSLGDRCSEPFILVAKELTPSHVVELDSALVLGVATDAGTRTAHASILSRSLGIPAVVGLGDLSRRIQDGVELILDGSRGKVVVAPTENERHRYHDREVKIKEAAEELKHLVDLEPETLDGVRIGLYANLELPRDAEAVVALNADGVGLFRTEFLIVGKAAAPDEEEQYEAFKSVVERVSPRPVTIRTYDLGGDKLPLFMPPISEENPFLGWRGLRVYHLVPDLFHSQVRAILRAAAHGPVRLLVPMVNSVEDVRFVQAVLQRARDELRREGMEHGDLLLGVMLETPAAVAITEVLGRYVDFFSLGTNDLIQYMLAVDRGNAQLAPFFDLYHPGLLRYIRDAVEAAARARRPVCVCGESASDPLAAALLIGLGIRGLSCAPGALLEQKLLIRSLELGRIEELVRELQKGETGEEIRERLLAELSEAVSLPSLDSISSLSQQD
ncbi:MAG: phosphoenolpyruvate--protein phosphotransferase [Gemmatimonadales bacterium]